MNVFVIPWKLISRDENEVGALTVMETLPLIVSSVVKTRALLSRVIWMSGLDKAANCRLAKSIFEFDDVFGETKIRRWCIGTGGSSIGTANREPDGCGSMVYMYEPSEVMVVW